MDKAKDKVQGFTLLELIVTLSIVVILATAALPTFNNTLANTRLSSNTNLMVGAINYARSEAVRLGTDVRVQGTADGWEVIRVDDPANPLRTFTPPAKDISIIASVSDITYEASGYRKREAGVAPATITVCDARGMARQINVSIGGSIRVEETTC